MMCTTPLHGRSIVSSSHCGIVGDHTASFHNLDVFTLKCLDHLKGFEILRKYSSASDDVVFEHSIEFLDVGRVEQVGQSSGRDLGKSLVGGCEDGKRARAGESAGEVASDEGSDEGGEVRYSLGKLDDVLGGGSAGCGHAVAGDAEE